jgi:hypothetical protein
VDDEEGAPVEQDETEAPSETVGEGPEVEA